MKRRNEMLIGGLFVTIAIFVNIKFMGIAIMALNVGLMVSYFVWASGEYRTDLKSNKLIPVYAIGIVVQGCHFLEEYFTGFHKKFPAFFGYQWSDPLYIAFNLVYLFLFVLAVWGIIHKARLAYILVWFFALLAGVGNGIFHPAISIIQGGYFPGLITSPFLFIVGLLMIKQLRIPKNQTVLPGSA